VDPLDPLGDSLKFKESDLASLLVVALRDALDYREVERDYQISGGMRADLVASNADGNDVLIEVKARSPQTIDRVGELVTQLLQYKMGFRKRRGNEPQLILALLFDVLTPERRLIFESHGISVWDRERVTEMVSSIRNSHLNARDAQLKTDYLAFSMRRSDSEFGRNLATQLRRMPSGRSHWSVYQKLCADILEYLFCPPLELPLYESSNASKVNRRDIILPNYVADGFWNFLHRAYRAEYIVVDAKNYKSEVKKDQILQLVNYLSEGGTGLLGLILTRKSEDRGAYVIRREQWLIHRKMVIVMGDNDVQQMIENRRIGSPPEEVLRQKIQDFRLGI
jgi:Holliday junction resolvase